MYYMIDSGLGDIKVISVDEEGSELIKWFVNNNLIADDVSIEEIEVEYFG